MKFRLLFRNGDFQCFTQSNDAPNNFWLKPVATYHWAYGKLGDGWNLLIPNNQYYSSWFKKQL